MKKTAIIALAGAALAATGCAATETQAAPGWDCEGYVALTYDDGPTPYTQDLTDALVEHGMVGVYLLVGENIEADPESVEHAMEHGMVLGTHTWSHPEDMTMLLRPDQYSEIRRGEDALEAVTGEKPTLWRPPHSLTDGGVEEALEMTGTVQVMWTLDSQDWWAGNPAMIEEHMQPIEDGDIVVLHDQEPAPDAVPVIAALLESRGLCAVGLTPEGEIERPA